MSDPSGGLVVAERRTTLLHWRPGDAFAPLRALVARGGVLAVPTESSYGLAVDPRSEAGVEAVYRIKGRDAGKALPVAMATVASLVELGVDQASPIVAWSQNHWPAPLTAVVPLTEAPSNPTPPLPAAAGLGTLAVRIPDQALLRQVLTAVGPLTVTSANKAGEAPILDVALLQNLLANEDAAIVDGGTLAGGPPSTLVRWHDGGVDVLRHGAFSWSA